MPSIQKVAVIGSGVMGSGIAAQAANAGLEVVLLDIVAQEGSDRDAVTKGAIQRMRKTNPAPLMHPRNAARIRPGNLDDHLEWLADCDLVIEAVLENLEIKKDLYSKINAHRGADCIVTSNTSTIPLDHLVADMPEGFRQHFAVTHFFNPPRYMRLLELVAGPDTQPEVITTLRDFGDRLLGKSVVDCKDTPGFIANRIGILWMGVAVRFAFEDGITVEEADAVIGKPMGIPKTGIFGLLDLVGIDLQPHVERSMLSLLPEGDMYRDIHRRSEFIEKMIADGYTGRKGKGGFYRLNRSGGEKIKEALDLSSGEYHPAKKPVLESVEAARGGLRALVEHPDRGGQYAWRVLSHTLSYAAVLVPEIADDIHAVDEAMKNGYAWKWGPFELIDKLGARWFAERLAAEGMAVPPLLEKVGDGSFYRTQDGRLQYFGTDGAYHNVERAEGVLLLSDIKRSSERLAGNASASLWDIGDKVLCLEFHSKMNAVDEGIMMMAANALKMIPAQGYQALVIHNEGTNFSVGANVGLALFAANIAAWPIITESVKQGQDIYKKLKFAPFPVVGAPSGMALGGGCEILLHCDAIEAHAETYMGLVEVGVGLVPAWGGCKEMLLRWSDNPRYAKGPMPAVSKVFETIATATVAKSAEEARALLYLRPGDGIVMNRDRLLAHAKERALSMARDYTPPEPCELQLPGPSGEAAMTLVLNDFKRAGKATDHDVTVGKKLAHVLAGGKVDPTETLAEDKLLNLERTAIVDLLRTSPTLDRIEHMLETGKPLRN
ncbi:MAG: 3-hydroxyacyl-CoA dehydrogenase [Acidiferrobacteraceae bacterium]|nr:3-hydroxyacyl-CoA dehydrogenase [Acidiferrobacteraceae bacterium]|tara:strand:+ start:6373 stop:8700 length:2328 start_codon:yes stop_codon:yes gene_type:complete